MPKQFASRGRAITTFCSQKLPFPLFYRIASRGFEHTAQPHPPSLWSVLFICHYPLFPAWSQWHPLPRLFVRWFVIVPVNGALPKEANQAGKVMSVYLLKEQKGKNYQWQTSMEHQEWMLKGEKTRNRSGKLSPSHRMQTDGMRAGAHTGYHPAGEEEWSPTRFSAKAQCTRDPDGQRCPFLSWLPRTLSRTRTSKQTQSQQWMRKFVQVT